MRNTLLRLHKLKLWNEEKGVLGYSNAVPDSKIEDGESKILVFEKQGMNAEANNDVKKTLEDLTAVQFWGAWKGTVDETMETTV